MSTASHEAIASTRNTRDDSGGNQKDAGRDHSRWLYDLQILRATDWRETIRQRSRPDCGECMATVSHIETEGVRVVLLGGSLTQIDVAPIEKEFAIACDHPRLVIDLSGIDVINTPGLALLLSAQREKERRDGQLVLTGTAGAVAGVLHRCRLDDVFEVSPTRETAIARLRHV